MKHPQRLILLAGLLLSSAIANGQSIINAGPDDTICLPGSATLTATVSPTIAGTSVSLSDDQYTGVINIGFPFTYFGTTYSQCLISSNNYITFNTGSAGGYSPWSIPAAIPSPSDPVNSIMCPWQDLLPPSGGTITYATLGTAPNRVFVVAFCSVRMFSCTNMQFTSQIKLFETTNVIETHIANKPVCSSWNGGAAIHGIQNNAGTIAYVVPGRNFPTQWTTTNDGYRWTPTGMNSYSAGPIPYNPSILSAALNPIQWYVGNTLVGTGPTITVSPNTTTTYTATVTGGCIGTSTDQVTVVVSSASVSAGSNVNICYGGNTQLNATSPNNITSWSWSPTTALSNPNIANPVASPTITTTYVVTGSTAAGCTATSSVVVSVTPMTTANAGPDDSICSGSCTTLQGSGGVAYSWAPAGSITGPSNIANPQACPTVTTTFVVTVTDANGCIGTDTCVVYVAPQVLSATTTPTDNTCFSACNGQATANPSGGFSPYTYSWSNSSTNQTATSLCAGSYNVTVTDNIGCTATASVNITEPTAVVIQSTSITTANCGQNDGSVTIAVNGGTPPYNIVWPSGNNGLTENNLPPGQVCVYAYDANGCGDTLCVNVPNTPGASVSVVSSSNITCFNACDGWAVANANGGTSPYNYVWNTLPQNQSNDTAMALCPGTYTVMLTDANGCKDSAFVTITQPQQLTNVPAGTQTICIGQSANLSDVGMGGTPPYSYHWTDGVTSWTTQNITVSPTVTTTYTVYVTDANSCQSANQMAIVTVNPPLTVQAMNGVTVCGGTPVNLTANGNGGDGNLTYTWLTPAVQTGQNITVTVNSTTTYTVILTDGCNTAPDTSTVTVTVNPAPVPTFAATTATTGCEDLCVAFTNSTPNTASVVWTFGNNLGTSTAASPTFCFTSAGNFDVTATVTDNIGCVGTTTLQNYITVWPLPIADFSASPQPATMLNNQVSFTDQSIGAVSWIWSFGQDDSSSVLQNPVYAFQDSGVFMVQLIVTNQYGCQDSTTEPIIVQEDYAVYIPNSFTPNGDGHNDVFFPQGMGVNMERYTMYIFDRWGNMIYQTSAWPGGWDGTTQGTSKVCQVDTYVYKIVTMDPNGARHIYVGQVNLIR